LNILSFFNSEETLFVEIDKRYLKLLQSTVKGNSVMVSKLLVEPVLGLSEEEISGLLTDIINQNNITFNSISVIIPRERVITRYMKFPATNNSEIESMVSFEITKQTPYSQDDIVSDYRIKAVDEQGYSKVEIVFSPKSEISRINSILGHLTSRLKYIYFSSEAISAWPGLVNIRIKDAESSCLINIDSSTTEIAVISAEGLCFSRSIAIGADDIMEIQEQLNPLKTKLVKEIEQSIALYLKEKGPAPGNITRIVLTGAASVCKDFIGFLKTAINTPSELLNPLSGIQLSDDALSESGIPEDASVCAICGGIFIEDGINLMPQDQKIKSKKILLFKKAAAISAFFMLMFLVFAGTVFFKIHQRQNILKKLESMYSQIEKVSADTEEKLKKLRSIKSHIAEGESSLDVIYNLYFLVPEGIALLDFDYDDISKSVRFGGRAGRMSDVFSLVSVLESSEAFSNVQTRSVLQRRTREGTVVDFQIRCNFKTNK
jgi:Tfp pilus assembly PilM family ATPase